MFFFKLLTRTRTYTNEMLLQSPLPCGSLNRADKNFPPTLLAVRTPELVGCDSHNYFHNHWLPVYRKIHDSRERLLQTVPTMFGWRSGAGVCTLTQFEFNGYNYETIMALHACAVGLWNAGAQQAAAGDIISSITCMKKAAGIYRFVVDDLLSRFGFIPPDGPVELDVGFTMAMSDMCLGEMQFKLAAHKASVDAANQTIPGLYMGCFPVFTRCVNVFDKIAKNLSPTILKFAYDRQRDSYMNSLEFQINSLKDPEGGAYDVSRITAMLEVRINQMPSVSIRKLIEAKRDKLMASTRRLGGRMMDGGLTDDDGATNPTPKLPQIEFKEPIQYIPFTLAQTTENKRDDSFKDAILSLIVAFDGGRGWPLTMDKVIQVLGVCKAQADEIEHSKRV